VRCGAFADAGRIVAGDGRGLTPIARPQEVAGWSSRSCGAVQLTATLGDDLDGPLFRPLRKNRKPQEARRGVHPDAIDRGYNPEKSVSHRANY
jgi:hypothetical protein